MAPIQPSRLDQSINQSWFFPSNGSTNSLVAELPNVSSMGEFSREVPEEFKYANCGWYLDF